MSWIAVGIAAISVGTAAYSADKQRKAQHQQQDALKASRDEDARKSAEAETGAQVAANAAEADAKRRRRTNALALGDPNGTADTLGAASGGTALSAGVVPTKQATTVLGSAAR